MGRILWCLRPWLCQIWFTTACWVQRGGCFVLILWSKGSGHPEKQTVRNIYREQCNTSFFFSEKQAKTSTVRFLFLWSCKFRSGQSVRTTTNFKIFWTRDIWRYFLHSFKHFWTAGTWEGIVREAVFSCCRYSTCWWTASSALLALDERMQALPSCEHLEIQCVLSNLAAVLNV